MKDLISDMRKLAGQARSLAASAETTLADTQTFATAIAARPAGIDPWSSAFAEFDRFRRAAVHDVERLARTADRLVGDGGVLPGLAGPMLDSHLETMFASGRPIKEWLRSVEDKTVRKALNHRFRQFREQRILAAIAAGAVNWDSPIAHEPFGVGIDERIVEFPLAFQVADFARPGRILDAGAAMNLPYIRDAIGVPVASVIHFTQSGTKEMCRFQDDRYSYVFGDLRRTDFRDGAFDRILCVSTLEHVGMDNSRYGEDATGAPIAAGDGSHLAAVAEMLRILAPAGELIITVPYGVAVSHGWYQVFDRDMVAQIVALCAGNAISEKYYYYQQGWCEGGSTPPDLAGAGTDVAGLWALRVSKSAAAGGA